MPPLGLAIALAIFGNMQDRIPVIMVVRAGNGSGWLVRMSVRIKTGVGKQIVLQLIGAGSWPIPGQNVGVLNSYLFSLLLGASITAR